MPASGMWWCDRCFLIVGGAILRSTAAGYGFDKAESSATIMIASIEKCAVSIVFEASQRLSFAPANARAGALLGLPPGERKVNAIKN